MKTKVQAGHTILFEQLEDLIDLINSTYDFNFTGYSRASLKRRVTRVMWMYDLPYSDLKSKLLTNPAFFKEFLLQITVNVTEMFRDPSFYKSIRGKVLPDLASFHKIKIWSAGCSTGEEVYSLAILLDELDLYKRSFIYGTDINTNVLNIAKNGVLDARKMKVYSENYEATEPSNSLKNYFTENEEQALISDRLKKNTLFSIHNLVSDGFFNEFQLITCRNVLIYFNVTLQEQVLKIFYDSLCPSGFLCLGSKETLRGDELLKRFKVVDKNNNIYQKIA